MKLVGLMLVRNSDWVIGLSLRAALMWCDAVVVLLHNCVDGTSDRVKECLMEFPAGRIVARVSKCADWEEMRLRQEMLEIARGFDATHLALIDDDELLTGNVLPTIRFYVESIPVGSVLQLSWLQLRHSINEVMVTGMWGWQPVSVAFRDDKRFHWAAEGGYDHHHRHPLGMPFNPHNPLGSAGISAGSGLMHLQCVSWRRLAAKQFLYQLVDMKRWPGRKSASEVRDYYVRTVRESVTALTVGAPPAWWAPYAHLLQYLHVDAVPWQEAECRRMIEESPDLANGLDDFGVMRNWKDDAK